MKKKNLFLKVLFLVATLMVIPVNVSFAESAASLNSIVAVVNKDIITQAQLQREASRMKGQMQAAHAQIPDDATLNRHVLDHLIDMNLQLEVAKNMKVEVDDSEVDGTIKKIANENKSTIEAFRIHLEKEGYIFTEYREEIRKQIIVNQLQQKILGSKVDVTEKEVNDFMKEHGDDMNPVQYHIVSYLFPLASDASEADIKAQEENAKVFARGAYTGSNSVTSKLFGTGSKQTKPKQNDFGWRKFSQLPAVYTKALSTMSPGEFSKPIRAGNGIHIVKLLESRGDVAGRVETKTHVREILIKQDALTSGHDAKIRLTNLKIKLENGADFSALAKANSQDTESVNKGGDLGWIVPNEFGPFFDSVMNQLQDGEVSDVFETPKGWHIIQVLGRKQVSDSSELLRSQARNIVFQQKFNKEVETWMKELREQAYIKIMI